MEHALFWESLVMFSAGALLVCVGFSRRDNTSGIVLLWMGAACMLALVFYLIPKLLHLT